MMFFLQRYNLDDGDEANAVSANDSVHSEGEVAANEISANDSVVYVSTTIVDGAWLKPNYVKGSFQIYSSLKCFILTVLLASINFLLALFSKCNIFLMNLDEGRIDAGDMEVDESNINMGTPGETKDESNDQQGLFILIRFFSMAYLIFVCLHILAS